MTLEKFEPKKKAAMVVPIMPTKKYRVTRNAPQARSKPSPINQRNQRAKTIHQKLNVDGRKM